MRKNNKEIREALKLYKVYQWELAEAAGISESNLCVSMRKELPEETKRHYVALIKSKAAERGGSIA